MVNFVTFEHRSGIAISRACCVSDWNSRASLKCLYNYHNTALYQENSTTFWRRVHRGACSGVTQPGQWRRGRGCSPSRHRARRRPPGSWSASEPQKSVPWSSCPSRLKTIETPDSTTNPLEFCSCNRNGVAESHIPRTFWVRVARIMISVRMGVTRTSTPE